MSAQQQTEATLARLQQSRIPVNAYKVSLKTLGQPVLRSVLDDSAYISLGQLKSISLNHTGADAQQFHTVVARFAAELCLKGQEVLYVRLAAILRELRVLNYSSETPPISPVIGVIGKGFLVIPDITTGAPEGSDMFGVCDLLIDHVSQGGGLVLGNPAHNTLSVPVTPEFESVVSSFMSFNVADKV